MKKILIALDYNPSAKKVAEIGHEMATALKAQTILLHVISDPTYYAALHYSTIMGFENYGNVVETNKAEELRTVAQVYLDRTKELLNDRTIQTMVRRGTFAETILDTAKYVGADIIVMGTHSRKGLEKVILGSVAEKVLHGSPVPVLIVPAKAYEENNF